MTASQAHDACCRLIAEVEAALHDYGPDARLEAALSDLNFLADLCAQVVFEGLDVAGHA